MSNGIVKCVNLFLNVDVFAKFILCRLFCRIALKWLIQPT